MAIEETLISAGAIIAAALIAFVGITLRLRKDTKERDRTALADKKYDLYYPAARDVVNGLQGLSNTISRFSIPNEAERAPTSFLLSRLAFYDFKAANEELTNTRTGETEEMRAQRISLLLQEHVHGSMINHIMMIDEARPAFFLLSQDRHLVYQLMDCENLALDIINEIVFEKDLPGFETPSSSTKIDQFFELCNDSITKIRNDLERIRVPREA